MEMALSEIRYLNNILTDQRNLINSQQDKIDAIEKSAILLFICLLFIFLFKWDFLFAGFKTFKKWATHNFHVFHFFHVANEMDKNADSLEAFCDIPDTSLERSRSLKEKRMKLKPKAFKSSRRRRTF
jgi:hypothetical protein